MLTLLFTALFDSGQFGVACFFELADSVGMESIRCCVPGSDRASVSFRMTIRAMYPEEAVSAANGSSMTSLL